MRTRLVTTVFLTALMVSSCAGEDDEGPTSPSTSDIESDEDEPDEDEPDEDEPDG